MDVVAAVLACSLYPGDDALVRALAESNSHGNPFFVVDPTVDPSEDPRPEPRSAAEALERAEEVRSKQAVPLLGLLEVPPPWLAAFGRSLADGFDPCTNVAVGTAYLSAFDRECNREWPARRRRASPERRACVLHRYADALRMPDLVDVVTLELRLQRPGVPAVFQSPIFPPDAPRSWGPDRIFSPLPILLPPAPGSEVHHEAR